MVAVLGVGGEEYGEAPGWKKQVTGACMSMVAVLWPTYFLYSLFSVCYEFKNLLYHMIPLP